MQLINGTMYDPSSSVAKATSTRIAMTAFDTTNLRLTFTTPVNCTAVLVRMRTNLSGATTMPQVLLGVLDGATVKGRQVAQGSLPGTALATTNVSLMAEFLVTGLTGNTSYTWDAAYGVETEVASTNIHYGGPNNTTANDAWGGFAFEVWDPAPAPANFDVFSIDSNGRIDVIKIAGTTQTARDIGASVLLSSGTGTGQLDFTSGVVKSNETQILGTAISTPATAGILDVNVKNIDNDAASASGTVTFPNATLASTTNITAGTITTVTNLTNAPTSGDLTATMKTSVENAVLNADMTGHQTQGSLGQAIGDPIADTNTIYKATVTDASGATVGVDTTSILSRIPTALSANGNIKSDIKEIEDQLTSGNNATLNLKKLNITNLTGSTVELYANGGDAVNIVSDSHGLYVADAFGLFWEAATGLAVNIISDTTTAVGLYASGNGHGLEVQGAGTGKSINAPQNIAVSDGNLTLAAIASAVWANATRTLTSFGTLVADVWAIAIETGYTAKQSMRLMLSALAGKLSGAATTNVQIRNVTDDKTRINATVDSDGNRTAVSHDVSD